jgi:hypothetical protein
MEGLIGRGQLSSSMTQAKARHSKLYFWFLYKTFFEWKAIVTGSGGYVVMSEKGKGMT